MPYTVYHEITCPECGAALTTPDSVEITITANAGRAGEVLTALSADGEVIDPTGDVALGLHGGSMCVGCGAQLEELEHEPESSAAAEESRAGTGETGLDEAVRGQAAAMRYLNERCRRAVIEATVDGNGPVVELTLLDGRVRRYEGDNPIYGILHLMHLDGVDPDSF